MKLGPHIFDGSTEGQRLAAGARSPGVKLVGGYSHAAEYAAPGRIVWGRVVPGPDGTWRQCQPVDYYATFIAPHVRHPANAALKVWETGLNEDFRKATGETPDYPDMAARGAYEAQLAALLHADGKIPVLGQFAVGTPSGTPAEQREAWRAWAAGIRAAYSYGGYISLHTYSSVPGWTGPLDALIAVMAEMRLDVPLLVSECGHEPGWRSVITPEAMAAELVSFDRELVRYPQVKAAVIYSYGNCPPQWENYRMDDPTITDALIAYANTAPPPAPIEKPLFSFPGAGLTMILYAAPAGKVIRSTVANWPVDVYETRGQWWRVTTAPSNYWVRMNFA